MKKIIVIGLFLLLALTFIFACAKTETTSSSVAPAPNRYLQSFSGQNIIDWDYHIYLSNRPVVPSPEACVLRLNGRVLSPEVDYVFPSRVYIPILGQYMTFPTATLAYLNDNNDPSDGYATGTILITNQALISPESDLSVVYEYLPSYRVIYSLRGKDSVGPYPLVPFYPVVPGSEIVEVSDGETIGDATIYTRNSSPEALDAGITGFSINYGSAEAYLVFNSSIASTESIRVEYYSTKGAPEKVLVFD